MKRRSFIAALLSSLSWPAWAQKWAIFQDQLAGGGSLPAGVTLRAVDGNPNGTGTFNWYGGNSFTAATYFDTNFPIILWLYPANTVGDITRAQDVGANLLASLNIASGSIPSNITTLLRSAGMYLAMGLYPNAFGGSNTTNAIMASFGSETAWIFLNDEPGYWNNPGSVGPPINVAVDIVTTMAGTNILCGTTAAGMMTNRPIWSNQFHTIMDNPPSYLSGGFNPPITSIAGVFSTSTPNNDSIPRHINITGMDYYFHGTDLFATDGTNTGGSFTYGLVDLGAIPAGTLNPGVTITPALGSLTVPFNSSVYNGALIGTNNTVQISNGVDEMFGFATGPPSGGNITYNITVHTGPGTPAANFSLINMFSQDQTQRGSHYGDMIDVMRPYLQNHFPGPLISVVENGSPGGGGTQFATPTFMRSAAWSAIIHGALGLLWYNVSQNSVNFTSDTFGTTYYQTIQTGLGQTISIYDMGKAINALIKQLTPVIYSPFAEGSPGYVNVTGDKNNTGAAGFRAPYRPGVAATSPFAGTPTITAINESGCYPFTGQSGVTGSFPFALNNPSYNFNASLASAFEVMAKWYTGGTSNAFLTPNTFYIFAGYRGSASDTNIVAHFTIANTGRTSVTRISSDGVLGAAASGGNTSVQVGDSSHAANGDTVIIQGAASWINGTWTVQGTPPDSTHIVINVLFGGSVNNGSGIGTGLGTLFLFHNIPLVGNTTFSDTFTTGEDIGIYRVN